MNFEITGKLAVKFDTQQVKESFKKREFVLEISEEINGNSYTNYAKMQLVQNKCDLLDRFNVGEPIKVNFSLRGNKWERDGKVSYITNLDAWKIESAGSASPSAPQAAPSYAGASSQNGSASDYNPSPENADDLPF